MGSTFRSTGHPSRTGKATETQNAAMGGRALREKIGICSDDPICTHARPERETRMLSPSSRRRSTECVRTPYGIRHQGSTISVEQWTTIHNEASHSVDVRSTPYSIRVLRTNLESACYWPAKTSVDKDNIIALLASASEKKDWPDETAAPPITCGYSEHGVRSHSYEYGVRSPAEAQRDQPVRVQGERPLSSMPPCLDMARRRPGPFLRNAPNGTRRWSNIDTGYGILDQVPPAAEVSRTAYAGSQCHARVRITWTPSFGLEEGTGTPYPARQ